MMFNGIFFSVDFLFCNIFGEHVTFSAIFKTDQKHLSNAQPLGFVVSTQGLFMCGLREMDLTKWQCEFCVIWQTLNEASFPFIFYSIPVLCLLISTLLLSSAKAVIVQLHPQKHFFGK